MDRAQALREAVEVKGHGQYREIEEGDFLKEVTGSDRVICHFFHPEFRRCQIVDKHLTILAAKYLQTKFIKIDVLKAPFFVTKLNVKILPAIIMFKDGIAYDRFVLLLVAFISFVFISATRIVGFDEFGGSDDFQTGVIEKRLGAAGMCLFCLSYVSFHSYFFVLRSVGAIDWKEKPTEKLTKSGGVRAGGDESDDDW